MRNAFVLVCVALVVLALAVAPVAIDALALIELGVLLVAVSFVRRIVERPIALLVRISPRHRARASLPAAR